jgi:hypothetical protein
MRRLDLPQRREAIALLAAGMNDTVGLAVVHIQLGSSRRGDAASQVKADLPVLAQAGHVQLSLENVGPRRQFTGSGAKESIAALGAFTETKALLPTGLNARTQTLKILVQDLELPVFQG